ncbi:hypothetical protein LTS08_008612 [Lithohypha guttulata]|uniref:uncharacterized protein n=1 Tax=Lithohypha guttulata TaxID=1690604 RepID=UPI002DDE5BBB|nr:hypothetical protein LTS08_008612 [Lithohypha guttulata]
MLIEDAERLEKIDQLYGLRLDQLVSLPVLAVVGDQSSGKSSVLEALTGLPFPRDSTLCTRFPTQIVFKRQQERSVNVSINPAAGTTQLLGLSPLNGCEGDRDVQRSFSNDLLKIEVSGPDHDHFSVVDLPGLFRKPTEGLTTKEDMLLVRDMVSMHLQNERSIILAVVPANVDIATQEIIQMAEDADPGRDRTLAVLTKPDLVDKGAEAHTPLHERNTNEGLFFAQSPWKAVASDRAGIQSLKTRLNTLSVEASRQSFDEVRAEIQRKLSVTKTKLQVLGQPRGSTESQRVFLLQLASQYQSLINKATDAHYGRDECFHRNPNMRLATVVMEESDNFSVTLAKRGAHRAFASRDSGNGSQSEDEATMPESEDGEGDQSNSTRDFPELRTILQPDSEAPAQNDEPIDAWIARKHKEFRGFEIGSTNPSLITALIYEQTNSWHYHASSYVRRVIERIHRCIHDILVYVCPDEHVRQRLWKHLQPRLAKAYGVALDHTRFLVKVERQGYPVTLNHYFAQTMIKRRRQRIERTLKNMQAWHTKDDARQPLLKLDDILNSFTSNEEQHTEEIGDVLRSYHKVARKRFADAVAKQVVDYMLICSEEGPLHVFSPEFVGKLGEGDLQKLASEDVGVADQRKQLQAEAEILQQGCAILL